jgi:hypothetical protein
VLTTACEDVRRLALPYQKPVRAVSFEPGTNIEKFQAKAFDGFRSLRSLRVPPSIVSIGSECFGRCDQEASLESITFEPGSRLTTLEPLAFAGCTDLKSIRLPASVRDISGTSFAFSGVETIEFESGNEFYSFSNHCLVNFAGTYLVRYLGSSSAPVVDDGILTLGSYCFANNKVITAVIFRSTTKLREIESSAFENCEYLKSMSIPPSVEVIGRRCFFNCVSLMSVSLVGSSLIRIEEEVFQHCLRLSTISIPGSVELIGEHCFRQCLHLVKLPLPADSKLVGISARTFYRCTRLSSLSIPASVETIGESAFSLCDSLVTLNIGQMSRLRLLLDIPPVWTGMIELPDSVEIVRASSPTKKSSKLMLKFGRESKLERLDIWMRPRPAARRVFLGVPCRVMKRMRSDFEFLDPWTRVFQAAGCLSAD